MSHEVTMLQIHRSDTPSIDAVIDRFATTAERKLTFFQCEQCTVYSTARSFLNIDICNTYHLILKPYE